MKNIILPFFLFFLFSCSTYIIGQESTPFGVCAHLQNGEEHRQMPNNLQMMHNAGIRWVRADFSWDGIESPRGNWKFNHIDKLIEESEKSGVNILPLLLYDVEWASPAYKHLDLWLEYVEKTVTRYKDKIKYWEVWNEPNLFWEENPHGADYATLLEATYKKIKEIDPTLTVLYGGTSGIPMTFIEQSFQAGAGAFFDIANIHPYRGRLDSMDELAKYQEDIVNLQRLMAKYNIADKKIWITEMGWSTWTTINQTNKEEFKRIRKEKNISFENSLIAVLFDKDYQTNQNFSKDYLQSLFSNDYDAEYISINDLKNADLLRYKAIFIPSWEEYNADKLFEDIIPNVFRYLHKGGKIFFYGDGAITEEEQAWYLSQSILLSFRFGIERFFWYEFQSPEYTPYDREAHFGITYRNLEPKPAYNAYATLSKVFPEGSVIDKSLTWNRKNFCQLKWKQKDGTHVWAVWNPAGNQQVKVKIGKGLQYALDYLGNKLPITQQTNTLSIGQGTTYIVGPESLIFD